MAVFVSVTFATGVGLIVTEPEVVVPPEELGVVCVSTAVLTIEPEPTVTSAVMVNCTDAPLANVPIVHVTTLLDSVTVVPPGAVPFETKTSPAGRASVTLTPAADCGPLLVTVSV